MGIEFVKDKHDQGAVRQGRHPRLPEGLPQGSGMDSRRPHSPHEPAHRHGRGNPAQRPRSHRRGNRRNRPGTRLLLNFHNRQLKISHDCLPTQPPVQSQVAPLLRCGHRSRLLQRIRLSRRHREHRPRRRHGRQRRTGRDAAQCRPGAPPCRRCRAASSRPSCSASTWPTSTENNSRARLYSRTIDNPVEQALRLDAACMCVNLFQIPNQPEVGEQCVENILRLKPSVRTLWDAHDDRAPRLPAE
jgi:hypothetical protein